MTRAAEVSNPEAVEPVEKAPAISVLAVADVAPKVEPAKAESTIANAQLAVGTDRDTAAGDAFLAAAKDLKKGTPLTEAERAAAALGDLMRTADQRSRGVGSPEILPGGLARVKYDPAQRADKLEALVSGKIKDGSIAVRTYAERPDGLKGERVVVTTRGQETVRVYDPAKSRDGIAQLQTVRLGDKVAVTADYRGRIDGLVRETLTADPSGSMRVRTYSDGRREETRVGPDKKPETKYFGGDNKAISPEQFQSQQKSLLEANQKRRAAGEPLINEQEVRSQPAEQAARIGPPLPGEGIKLPPLKAGWGPYQAIEQANREHKLGLTPQQIKEAAIRIRDREKQERGNTTFRQGERLDFYTPAELAKRGRPLDGRTPGADNPVLKPGERRAVPVDGGPIAEKPLERNTNLEQRLNTFNSILKSEKPLTAEEADVFRRQLRDLSPAEIQQLRKLHDPSKPENFDKALRDKFATLPEGQDRHAHRWAEIEGHLKRTGKPGEDAAIQLRVDALEAKWAGYDGNRTFAAIQANTRGTLLNATEEQRKGIDTALTSLYGQSLSEFYEKGPGKNLTYNGNSWYSGEDKFTKSVLELTTKKGVDARTPQEQTALLDLALQEKSVDRFREVASKAAMTPEGRAHFFSNGGLEKINAKRDHGRGSDVAVFSEIQRRELTDLAQKGEESPLTQFKKAIGILSNTDTALADAVKRVAENPVQQELYLNGRQLAREKREPKTEAERAALEFYTELNKTFKSAHFFGSDRKAQNFDAQIANGTRGALSNGRLAELGSSWWQHSSDLFKAIEGASPEQLNALFDGARLDNGRPQSRGLDDARKSIQDNTNRQVNADRLSGLQDRKVAYGIELGQIADQIKDTPHGKPLDPKLIQQLQERVPAFKGLPQEKVQQVVDGYRLDLAVRAKSVDAAKLSKPEQQQLAAYRSLDPVKNPQEAQLKGFLQGREIQRNIDGIFNKPDQLDGTRTRSVNEYLQTLKPQEIGSLDMFRAIRNEAVQTNVRRDLKEALGDAKDGAAVIDALKNATPAERRRMKDEPQYAKEMLDLAQRASTNPESRLASKILLDSYANDRPLTPGQKATLDVIEKVAAVNGDFRDRQKAAIEALQQSLRLDKDGSLAKELAGSEQFRQAMQAALGTDQFRRGMPGSAGAQLSYDAMIKPLLDRGSVPVEQLQRLYGKGTAEFFKAAVLDATPQGLKYLKSAEGESERRAVLGALTPDGQALAQKILQQGEVKPQDRLRAFVVGLDKQESAIDFLKTTPAKERVEAIRGYNREFKGNLQEDLLKKVDETAKPTVTLLAAENQLTGSQAVVRSRELVTNSTETFLGGQALKYDSTVFRSLTDLALAERQYKGQIPPSVMDMRIKAIASDLKNFDGTKEQIADALIEAGITVAAVAATPFTGGASLTALMLATRIAAMSALGGGVGALAKGYLRGNYEHLYGDALKFGILTGANLLTGESLAVFTKLGSRAAASTVEKTLATPALNGVLKEVSPAVREQLEKGLADLIQKGVTAGGVKDDAVRALVGSVNGLSKETQQALAQGLINNLGGSIREVSTAGIRGTLDRLGRTSGTILRDGIAAGTGGFTGTIAEQLAEGRAVDLQQALLSGATNFFVGSAARGTIESFKALRGARNAGRERESFAPEFDPKVPEIVERGPREVGPVRTPRGPRDGRVIDLEPHEYSWKDDPAGLIEGPKITAATHKDTHSVPRLDGPPERLRLTGPEEGWRKKPTAPPFGSPSDIEKINPQYLKEHGFYEDKYPRFFGARYFEHRESGAYFGFDDRGRLKHVWNGTNDYKFEYNEKGLKKVSINAHDGAEPAVFNKLSKSDHPNKRAWDANLSDATDVPVKPGYVRLYASYEPEIGPPNFKRLSVEEEKAFKGAQKIDAEFRDLRQRHHLGDSFYLDPTKVGLRSDLEKLVYVDIPRAEFAKLRSEAGDLSHNPRFKIADEHLPQVREHIMSPSNPHAHDERWVVRKGESVPEVINGRPPVKMDGHGRVALDDLARGKQFLPEVITGPYEVKIVNHGASPEYVAKVQEALKSMPLHLRARLNHEGVTVRIVGRAGDLESPLSLRRQLRGWHSGSDMENSQGHFYRNKKEIVMPEQSLDSRNVWKSNIGSVESTIYHEAGHALDGPLKAGSKIPAFVEAYMKDVEALGARSWLGRQLARVPNPSKIDYFLSEMSDAIKNNGFKGAQKTIADARDEVFAELFAVMHGRSTSGVSVEQFKRAFPNSAKAMEDFLKSLEPQPVRVHSRHKAS